MSNNLSHIGMTREDAESFLKRAKETYDWAIKTMDDNGRDYITWDDVINRQEERRVSCLNYFLTKQSK